MECDLVVMGAGSGGLAAAKRAAAHGARVVIAEEDRVGGTCVIRGCIPKKMMMYAANVGREVRRSADFGWSVGDIRHDWTVLRERRDALVERLEAMHRRNLEAAGVTSVAGRARIVGPQEVAIGEATYRTPRVLLATGGRPVLPAFPGSEHAVTSEALFDWPTRPERVLLVGGGYIAVEYAGILQGLGCDVTLVVRSTVLRGFDADLAAELETSLVKSGVRVVRPASVRGLVKQDDGTFCAGLTVDGVDEDVTADACALFATGRRPNVDGIGLEEVGVALTEGGAVAVDASHQTSVPGIYAVGDILDRANLTPVAIRAGRAVADHLFAKGDGSIRYDCIPTAIFSDPPIGTVGLSEAAARAEYGDAVHVYRTTFNPLSGAFTDAERKQPITMKLVVTGPEETVVGMHMIGADAPEIIQGFAVVVNAKLTKAALDAVVAMHPTTAEEWVLFK